MRTLGRICALALVALSGCGNAAPSAELADLRHRLDEQARRAALAEHKLDDLENRVFLLTDQVESQKVAALHREPRTLPVVRLHPDADADAPAVDAPAPPPAEARASDGRAADAPRPSLRIDGTRVAANRSTSKTLARPDDDLPTVADDDNLGVAPAPPVAAAARVEARRAEPHRAAPDERSLAAEPIALYRQSYEDLRAGRHDAAARGFREFVRRFPHHDYADNAQYWLGECYYDQKRYDEAAPQFRAVVSRWPTGNKAPDALLKLGFTLLALGRTPEARAALREVPAAYPHTEAARLASERLAQLSPTEGTK